jgi:hypothetical protein
MKMIVEELIGNNFENNRADILAYWQRLIVILKE